MSLKGIIQGVTNRAAKKVGALSSEAEAIGEARLQVCASCPLFKASNSTCEECGCFMKTKVLVRTSRCPLNKW